MSGRGFLWMGGTHGVLRPVGVSGDFAIPAGAPGLLWMGGIHGILRPVGIYGRITSNVVVAK